MAANTTMDSGSLTRASQTVRSKRIRALHILQMSAVYLVLILGSVAYAIPFGWMIRASLMSLGQFYEDPPPLIPDPIEWSNYVDAWNVGPVHWWLINSLMVVLVGVTIGLIVNCLVAYGFARLHFPGQAWLFVLVIATMMIPQHVTIIPQVILFREMNVLDTLLPLVLPLLGGSPFYIFILRQFFMTLPRELDDAAAIDGANRVRILRSVVLPLAKPAIATVAVFTFISHWNDFFFPFIVLQSAERLTLAVGMRWLQAGQYDVQQLHLQMAIALMAVAPIIIAFFLAQKHFIRGIALTGVKG